MNHKSYCLMHDILSFIEYEKESNGRVDQGQVLVWRVNGEEIVRSVGGHVTTTPKFKELALQVIQDRY